MRSIRPISSRPKPATSALRHRRAIRSGQRGSTIIEFAIVVFTLMVVLLMGIELDRMVFVYTNLADAAKAGVRYAIVRGGTRSSGASSPADSSPVSDMVKYYATAIDPSKLTVAVNYLDSAGSLCTGSNCNRPQNGDAVQVLVSYTYDPWIAFPFLSGVTLRANSQGKIVF